MKYVEAGHLPATKRNLWIWKQVKLSQYNFATDTYIHFIYNHWGYIVYPGTVLCADNMLENKADKIPGVFL